MGLNFHPRVIGRMAWKDGRDSEFLMLETAAFDPIWTEFNWDREGRCTVPCLRDYGAVFKGKEGAVKDEWESYDGPQLTRVNASSGGVTKGFLSRLSGAVQARSIEPQGQDSDHATVSTMMEPQGSFTASDEEVEALKRAGVVKEYIPEEDQYPPNNRTMENFFRGAWTYHIHNQVSRCIE